MHSLEVLHDDIAQKLQNSDILLIFSKYLIAFQFSPILLVMFGKIF